MNNKIKKVRSLSVLLSSIFILISQGSYAVEGDTATLVSSFYPAEITSFRLEHDIGSSKLVDYGTKEEVRTYGLNFSHEMSKGFLYI